MRTRTKRNILRLESMINHNQYMIETVNQKLANANKKIKELEYQIENPPLYSRGKFGKDIIVGVDLMLHYPEHTERNGYYYILVDGEGLCRTVHQNNMKK